MLFEKNKDGKKNFGIVDFFDQRKKIGGKKTIMDIIRKDFPLKD